MKRLSDKKVREIEGLIHFGLSLLDMYKKDKSFRREIDKGNYHHITNFACLFGVKTDDSGKDVKTEIKEQNRAYIRLVCNAIEDKMKVKELKNKSDV